MRADVFKFRSRTLEPRTMPRQHTSQTVLFATLFLTTALSAAPLTDIYEWEWIDPGNHSLGKQLSSTVCPGGAGLTPAPGMFAYNKDLTQGYLIGFDLTDAYFYLATLTDADFSGANLSSANFRTATLTGTNFSGANLVDTVFFNTTLTGTNFSGATIAGADFASTPDDGFTQTQFESTASYASGELTGVDLAHNDMTDWNFSGKDLTNVRFSDSTLTNANFSGATIAGTIFSSVTDSGFTRTQFESTASYASGELIGVDLRSNDLSGWNFAGKNLTNAVFTLTTLTNADFSGATITGAWFHATTNRGFTQTQFESTASYASGNGGDLDRAHAVFRQYRFGATLMPGKIANATAAFVPNHRRGNGQLAIGRETLGKLLLQVPKQRQGGDDVVVMRVHGQVEFFLEVDILIQPSAHQLAVLAKGQCDVVGMFLAKIPGVDRS